jgi:predicted O-linked N-acetylglucosamine transferase (SPINDLY family)
LALEYLKKAVKVDSKSDYLQGILIQSKIHTCNWDCIDSDISNLIESLSKNDKLTNPFPPLAYIDDQSTLTKIAIDWSKNKYPPSNFLPQIKSRPIIGNRRIKLGYFSADFHAHATTLLMAGLFEAHDRSKFELIAFSFGPDSEDPLTKRVRASFDRFIDIRTLSDRAVAAYARELNIDIAIDLKGFTQDSRTGIFAERAAPIQLNFLGFPGSMGAPYIDYIVADPYIIPQNHESAYTEKVLRLPHCYQPNDNRRCVSNKPQSRIEHDLPENAMVLCSFNNNYKITPVVFDIWMRILKKFPNAVLWLLKDNPSSEKNLRIEAAAKGVSPERLIFAKRVSPEDHLARHACADLFLDTYPCNAHTTASDALWSGLPIVTCSGNSFASRVAGSLLNTLNLPDLITKNLSEYEIKIVELINRPSLIAEVKERLKSNKQISPLFDTMRYTKDWEDLIVQVHKQSCNF